MEIEIIINFSVIFKIKKKNWRVRAGTGVSGKNLSQIFLILDRSLKLLSWASGGTCVAIYIL